MEFLILKVYENWMFVESENVSIFELSDGSL